MRVLIQSPPFMGYSENQTWHLRGLWPCRWISGKDLGKSPFVVAYRKNFTIENKKTIRVHVSADERYELFLDGQRIGRGSEFGSVDNWYYETYDIPLDKGPHVFVAKVWSLGESAPHAQISLSHGFIFAPEGKFSDQIGTGTSQWEYKKIEGLEFIEPHPGCGTRFWGTGANLTIHGEKFPWGFENGAGEGWKPVEVLHAGTNGYFRNGADPSHLMRPAVLPPMLEKKVKTGVVRFVSKATHDEDMTQIQVIDCDNLVDEVPHWELIGKGNSITIAPQSCRRVIYDLENYFCAYPSITVSGGLGSRINLQWAESLFNETQVLTKVNRDITEGQCADLPFNEPEALTKGNRDEIDGKYFLGVGDTFLPDGGKNRDFKTLWWQAGRYLQLHVQTTDSPLTIEGIELCETRYPLEMESSFISDDARLSEVIPIAFRGLQMCAHELYFDCPYYEQLMYSGDTRLQILATFTTTSDDRLPRKAVEIFNSSKLPSGLTRSLYPGRTLQIIPSFSLAWIGMVHDFALWRGDKDFIQRWMPGVRNLLEALLLFQNRDGLIERPAGWNFIDWVPEWTDGMPPGADSETSGIINWYMVYALTLAARMEEWMNEPELKAKWNRKADEIAQQTTAVYWNSQRGLFADDSKHIFFSEHAQCLAVLSGKLDAVKKDRIRHALIVDKNLSRTTISFTHFLFETYRELNLIDAFFDRMNLWFDLESQGFKTTPEQPEPARSDCHGWGAHPIYHYFATILGIRPGSMGFATVDVNPQPGPLKHIKGKLAHPFGWIEADFTIKNDHLSGSILLPDEICGTLRYNNQSISLQGGVKNIIDCWRDKESLLQ